MSYRVFTGNPATYQSTVKTKLQAIKVLFEHIDAMKLHASTYGKADLLARYQGYEMVLLADSDRIKRERFKPFPSGLHGPYYKAAFGSICNA